MRGVWFSVCLLVVGPSLISGQGFAAQPASPYFSGKTLTLTVGAARGSDADLYARLTAKYFGRHLAGTPAVVVEDKPENGGHEAAAYLYSNAPHDGTSIGEVPAVVLSAPLWSGWSSAGYEPPQFAYLGSAASESAGCFVDGDSPIKSARDAFVSEVTLAAMADGGPTRDGPVLLNTLLGTKFRLVSKKGGIDAILQAIGRHEVTGACGLDWGTVARIKPDWLPKGVLRAILQETVAGSPAANRLGIPRAADFVASREDRQVLALAYAYQAFARPFMLPPGTPPELVAMMRNAFEQTLADKALIAEAERGGLEIAPLSGAAVEARVAELYRAPAPFAERVRAALSGVTQ